MVQEQVEIVKRELEQSLEQSSEQTGSGTRARTIGKPKFLLGQ